MLVIPKVQDAAAAENLREKKVQNTPLVNNLTTTVIGSHSRRMTSDYHKIHENLRFPIHINDHHSQWST